MVNCSQYNNWGVRRIRQKGCLAGEPVQQDIHYVTASFMPVIMDITATEHVSEMCFSKWSVGDLDELVSSCEEEALPGAALGQAGRAARRRREALPGVGGEADV